MVERSLEAKKFTLNLAHFLFCVFSCISILLSRESDQRLYEFD